VQFDNNDDFMFENDQVPGDMVNESLVEKVQVSSRGTHFRDVVHDLAS
jgi:hypothetical protein